MRKLGTCFNGLLDASFGMGQAPCQYSHKHYVTRIWRHSMFHNFLNRCRIYAFISWVITRLDDDLGSDPFYQHGLALIPALISNYIHYNAQDEITCTCPNSNGATVEVWEWISYSIRHITGHVIIYPCLKSTQISEAYFTKVN